MRHNFETAHRLPELGGKCTSLHGHSWWAEWTIVGAYNPGLGTVAEFGAVKHLLRSWVDANLDHGTMLGDTDPLATVLEDAGCKVYRFDADHLSRGLRWPTVENTAELLGRVGGTLLRQLGAQVYRVRVNETHVNSAVWCAP